MTKFLNNADIKGYIAQTAVTSYLLKADSTGRLVAAIAGTDYQAPTTALLPSGGTAGQILAKIDGTNYNAQWIDNFAQQIKYDVKLGAALSKGTPVYVSSANGTNIIVSASSNATEATSSKTLGLLETGGALNDIVKVVSDGLLSGLNTSAATIGDPVWLGANGALIFGLANKPSAPAHLVYIGAVTRVHATNGEIFIKVQNGFELDELHNVALSSVADGQGLFYESATSLWKNKTIAAVLGYTPANGANYLALTGGTLTGDLTLSGTNPRLYFTDTDNNPDYFISNTDGTFTVYDVTNSVGRFKIYSGGNAEFSANVSINGDQKFQINGYNSATAFITSNVGYNSNYNGIGIYSNPTNANSLPAWYLDLGGLDGVTNNPDAFSILRKPSGGSLAKLLAVLSSGQLRLNTYTSATSFSGTAAGYLAFDSSGNVITVAGVAATDNTKLPLAGGTTTGIVTFGGSNNSTDNVRFQNTDGNYAYIRQTAASNSNNVWYDGTLGATMWYAWDNPGSARTANVYTQHIFGTGRGTSNEAVTINRGAISGTNSSGTTTYSISRDGSASLAGGITFTAPGGSILLKHAVSEVDAWIFQENATNWGLYWKNAPTGQHTFGGYTSVGAELVGMSAANASGNGILTSNFVGATTAYAQWMISNYTGYIWSASTIYAATSMVVGGNTVWHASNAPRAGNSNLMYYAGFTLDANSMPSNSTGFTYSQNAPYTGPIAKFSEDGYPLQLNATYSGGNNFAFRTRNGDAGSWNSWKEILHSSNYGSYALPLSGGTISGNLALADNRLYLRTNGDTNHFLWNADDDWEEMRFYGGTGFRIQSSNGGSMATFTNSGFTSNGLIRVNANDDLYLDYNYGCSIVGVYSSYRYQGVYSMGNAYKLARDGSSTGNLYGMAWSHPNAGGIAGNLNTHGLLVMENGTFLAAISGNIKARDGIIAGSYMYAPSYLETNGPVYATIMYDNNDRSYYVDPNSMSQMSGIMSNNWFRPQGDTGLYSQDYGGYFRRNTNSYGTWESTGYAKNGWGGYVNNNNYIVSWMLNTSGDFGFLTQNGNWWNLFYNNGNNCWGIGTDNTYSGDGFRCIKYGSSQYGWTTWSDRRAKENISNITGALDKVLNMRGVYFNYISDEAKNKRVGFIAQELESVLPEAVRYAEEIDEYNVEYAQIVSVLAEAIKEQNAKIQTLEDQLQTLLN